MKFLASQTRQTRSGCKTVIGLVLASAIAGSLFMAPAFADNRDRGDRRDDHGDRRDDYGQRDWRADRGRNEYRPTYPRPYYYAQPVRVPPPVYYEPRQSPGIRLFFPLDFRR